MKKRKANTPLISPPHKILNTSTQSPNKDDALSQNDSISNKEILHKFGVKCLLLAERKFSRKKNIYLKNIDLQKSSPNKRGGGLSQTIALQKKKKKQSKVCHLIISFESFV